MIIRNCNRRCQFLIKKSFKKFLRFLILFLNNFFRINLRFKFFKLAPVPNFTNYQKFTVITSREKHESWMWFFFNWFLFRSWMWLQNFKIYHRLAQFLWKLRKFDRSLCSSNILFILSLSVLLIFVNLDQIRKKCYQNIGET